MRSLSGGARVARILFLLVAARPAPAGPIVPARDLLCAASVAVAEGYQLGRYHRPATPLSGEEAARRARDFQAELERQRDRTYGAESEVSGVRAVVQGSDSRAAAVAPALRRLGRLVEELEREAPVRAYGFEGEDVAAHLALLISALMEASEAQEPYTLAARAHEWRSAIMGVVEFGVGTAVAVLGYLLDVPVAYFGLAGTASGLWAFRDHYLVRLREDFSSLTHLELMRELAGSREGPRSWLYLGSRYTAPWGLFRSRTLDRMRALPTRHSFEVDYWLEHGGGRPARLTLFVRGDSVPTSDPE